MIQEADVRTVRKKLGLSQEKLAEKLGVTRNTISRWELGEVSPSAENLTALNRLLTQLEDPAAPKAEPAPPPDALALVMCTVCLANDLAVAATNYDKSNSDYMVYNFETGETIYHSFADLPSATSNRDCASSPAYFPEDTEVVDPIEPYAVIGVDNRSKVTNTTSGPFCNTVLVRSTFPDGHFSVGSGFMLGPSAVATAAHCLYKSSCGGLATSVTVIPAQNGKSQPYGNDTVTSSNSLVVSTKLLVWRRSRSRLGDT